MNSGTLSESSSKVLIAPENWARQLFFKLCSQLQGGELLLTEKRQHYCFGIPAGDGLQVEIDVVDPAVYRRLLTAGSIGAAEAYMDGQWKTNDLVSLIRLLLRNRKQVEQLENGVAKVAGVVAKLWHTLNRNTVSGSRKNIAAHYDLGNAFFALFLDENLMYSSAVYETGSESLEQASLAKLDRICRKLDLSEQDHLLEIGAGWGGMAIYAARNFGCQVTTTTISSEQFQAAGERIEAAGLQHRITLLKQDYRQLHGKFDKVVSVEMIEAVGHQYLDGYFEKIIQLLKPDGMALIQAITIDDLQYEAALKEVDFIKRYIFPGSFIPCVNVLTSSSSKAGLRLFNFEDIGPSYACTLQAWRERFMNRLEEVRQLGFDERFIRMWEFYLSYCEGGFRERAISNVQMLLTRRENRRAQWL
jgi:cyclopropane-fatty-acyl-phospholipid synthase